MNPVQEDDWKNIPFPSEYETAILNRQLNDEEYTSLQLGVKPKDMDDRWFVYLKDSWVYFHRSWTGFCIFKIKLEELGGAHTLTEARISRNKDQYNSSGINHDLISIERALSAVVRAHNP